MLYTHYLFETPLVLWEFQIKARTTSSKAPNTISGETFEEEKFFGIILTCSYH